MKLAKYLAIPGMLSPIIYTVAWIIGGFVVVGYNHIRDDVSSLYAVGAQSRSLFLALFITAAALLFISSIVIHWGINNGDGLIVGPILYALGALIGLIVNIFFPLDEGGEMTTIFGKLHLILIVISGFLVMVSMIFFWLRTRKLEGWKFFSLFSIISVPLTLITMALSIAFAGGPYMGLVERFMVTVYEIYYFVISLMVFLRN